MIRLLLILALLGLLVGGVRWLLRHFLRRWLQSVLGSNQPKSLSEKLVQCAYCQTFIPQAKAIQAKGCYYCCQKHSHLTRTNDQDDQGPFAL